MVFKKKLRPTGSRKRKTFNRSESSLSVAKKLTDGFGMKDYEGSAVGLIDTTDFLNTKKYNPMNNLPQDLYRLFLREDLGLNQAVLKARAMYNAVRNNPLWTSNQELASIRSALINAIIAKYTVQYARLGINPTQNVQIWKEYRDKIQREQGVEIVSLLDMYGTYQKGMQARASEEMVQAVYTNYINMFNSSIKVKNGIWQAIVPLNKLGNVDVSGSDAFKKSNIFIQGLYGINDNYVKDIA